MPSPFELLHIADLVKLAAETAEDCSKINVEGDMTRIIEVCRRLKADAEELQALGEEMIGRSSGRSIKRHKGPDPGRSEP